MTVSRLLSQKLVHIVDHDPHTCEYLSLAFRLEGFRTEFSINSEQFYASLERRVPQIAIINLDLGPATGIGALRHIKSLRSGVVVFMLSDVPRLDAAVMAMKLGAHDVIGKPIDCEHLLQLAREAILRDVHIAGVRDGTRQIEVRGFSNLTPREREVLQLITNGQTNKEAGRELGISPRTIEVHRARVMDKLGAKNTADLLRIVLTK